MSDFEHWQQIMNLINEFTFNRLKQDSLSLVIEKGLQVFRSFPSCETSSLFLLDDDTKLLYHSASSPTQKADYIDALFTTLLDSNYIGELNSKSSGLLPVTTEDQYGNEVFVLLIALTSPEGLAGVAINTYSSEVASSNQFLLNLYRLFANQFTLHYRDYRLRKELESQAALSTQQIAASLFSVKQSNRELERIIDSVQAGILIYDRITLKILNVNSAAAQIIGLEKERITGKTRNDFGYVFEPDSPTVAIEKKLNVLRKLHLNGGAGKRIPVITSITAMKMQDQEVFIESFFDSTTLAEAERAKKESDHRFSSVFENASIGIVLSDLRTRIRQCNPAFASMLGFEVEELTGKSVFDLSPDEETNDELLRYLHHSKSSTPSPPLYIQKRFRRKDGTYVWCKVTSAFIRDDYGTPLFGLGIVEDISELKMNQERVLRQNEVIRGVSAASQFLLSEARFEIAMKSALQILGETIKVDRISVYKIQDSEQESESFCEEIYLWEKSPELFPVVQTIRKKFQYKKLFPDWCKAMMLGRFIVQSTNELPEDQKHIAEAQHIKTAVIYPIFLNEELWGFLQLDHCASAYDWQEGELGVLKTFAAGVAGALNREIERLELIASKHAAEEASRVKTSILTNMSHELRTPLNGIYGFAQILNEELRDNELVSMTDSILVSSKRLMNTLNSILTLSEIEAGKQNAVLETINLMQEIPTVVDIMKAQAKEKDLPIIQEYYSQDMWVYADRNFLSHILSHLIDNAIKYTTEGSVTIRVERRSKDNCSWGTISVQDTGIGIRKEHFELIFQAFRQGSEGLSRSHEGSGLGLTISAKMAILMGAHLTLESEIGKGSTFTLWISCDYPSLDLVKFEDTQVSRDLFPDNLSNDTSEKPLLLLVEDNQVNKDVIRMFLQSMASIDFAKDGLSAIMMAAQKQYRCVLMDINLGGGMNGVEAMQEIRKLSGYKTIPIIAVTGYATHSDQNKFLKIGFSHFLAKPFLKDELIGMIRAILGSG